MEEQKSKSKRIQAGHHRKGSFGILSIAKFPFCHGKCDLMDCFPTRYPLKLPNGAGFDQINPAVAANVRRISLILNWYDYIVDTFIALMPSRVSDILFLQRGLKSYFVIGFRYINATQGDQAVRLDC